MRAKKFGSCGANKERPDNKNAAGNGFRLFFGFFCASFPHGSNELFSEFAY
jgi:hypothetical protein